MGTVQSSSSKYEFRFADDIPINYANSRPQRFASTATATDKVFAVMGMPSLKKLPAGYFNTSKLRQSTKEEVIRYMSIGSTNEKSTGNDLATVGLNLMDGNLSVLGMVLDLVSSSPKYDPRVTLGFVVCFIPKVGDKDMASAVADCGDKMESMFTKTVLEISNSYDLPNGSYHQGKIKTPLGLKSAKVFLGHRGILAAEGYSPADRGGYPARIVAIPVGNETTNGSSLGAIFDSLMFKSRGEVTSEQLADALSKNLPADTVFYLPDSERGPVAVC